MKHHDYLDPDKITANLNTSCVGRKVVVFKSTSSTNDIAAEYSKNSNNNGLVIFAEKQTNGRGRSNHQWISGDHDSILCSIVLSPPLISAEMLSLTIAVAVYSY